MKITDIKIRKLYSTGNVRAIISITFDNCFAVHELRIIQNEDKLFVSMPSRIDETGAFRDIVHPINPETREYIEAAVIGFYDNYVNALNGITDLYGLGINFKKIALRLFTLYCEFRDCCPCFMQGHSFYP